MRARPALVAAFVVAAIIPVGSIAPLACASEGPRAVLVVDTEEPGGQHRFCVSLPDDSVSGIELIELAGEQHGLEYRLGFGGEAVCMLAGVGTEGDDCFAEYPEFWGYWRGNGAGGWSWSGTGAGSTTVEEGDVEGWSWGSGNDGSSHPQPPVTEFSEVCPVERNTANAPATKRRSPGTKDEPGERDTPAAAAGTEDDPLDDARGRDRGTRPTSRNPNRERPRGDAGRLDEPSDARDPAGTMHAAPAASERGSSRGPQGPTGPPPAGVAALGATVALGIAGGVLMRRRRDR